MEEGDLSIDQLLRELKQAEARDEQSPLVATPRGLGFRIVSTGLEGESVLVPTNRTNDSKRVENIDVEGGETTKAKKDGWREAITTSTLPFGARSLPLFMPPCRKELEDRYLSISAHVAAETQEMAVDSWFDKNTWSRSIGSSLMTVSMSGARSTLAVKPATDLKSFLSPYLAQNGPFPLLFSELDSGWEVEEVPIEGDAAGGYSVGSLDKPTARLSQYARGKTGSMNPFTPGGEDLPRVSDDGRARDRMKSRALGTPTLEQGNTLFSEEAVTASVNALDEDSGAPLLSVPPNVNFYEGLTPDKVLQGPPPWPGQMRPTNRTTQKGEETEKDNLPPPPQVVERAKIDVPTGGSQRMQAPRARPGAGGSAIDFSTLFAELDSDFDTSDEEEEDVKTEDANQQNRVGSGESRKSSTGHLSVDRLSSGLNAFSFSGTAVGGQQAAVGDETGQEAPLDSLLVSAAQPAGGECSQAQQSMTEHLLKNPDERKQPPRSGNVSSAVGNSLGGVTTGASGPTKGGGTAKWAVTELLDVSDFDALVPRPALRFPFVLDGFQKQAVARLERAECVFVSAHTSAGKTVVAEYAIAMAQQHMTRAIYTSPIKALSNQKYRDFKTRFGDVGLITGDVSINPEASCLIMTTEILRSMLYRGADLIRDIEWVIFDEVHYVNDSERGVVWEEVIIMLPDHANMIFLSATTPNTVEFCDWIGRTKRKPVHVISTTYRPVPLEHHLLASNELHSIMDNYGEFDSSGYNAAAAKLKGKDERDGDPGRRGGNTGGRGGGRGRRGSGGSGGRGGRGGRDSQGSRSQWQSLIKKLEKDGLLPVVVFSFSKKKCQECADGLSSVTLTNAKEKSEIHLFCASAVKRLQDQDARLPQVLMLKEMLSRGIGVHHGGLLPILKEIVEICFSRGLVKVLFATETFAMGVNMPARTVVFNGTRKHDGKDFRDLLPGEYTQMAGRAGRRGLDKVGTVIITCWSEPPQLVNLKTMLTGAATKLESQFRLKWNMILNLLRVEDMSVEDMMKRSFSEFRTQRELGAKDLPKIMKKCTDALAKLDAHAAAEPCIRDEEPDIEGYSILSSMVSDLTGDLLSYAVRTSKNARAALGSRRVLIITANKLVNAPAVVLRGPDEFGGRRASTGVALGGSGQDFMREARARAQGTGGFEEAAREVEAVKLLVLALCHEGFVRPALDEPIGLGDIVSLGKVSKKMKAEDVLAGDQAPLTAAVKMLGEVEDMLPSERDAAGTFTPLNLAAELKVQEMHFSESSAELTQLLETRSQSKCHTCPKLAEQYSFQQKRGRLQKRVDLLQHALSSEALSLFPDFQQRLGVLRSLGYVEGNTVQLKGRVACEINTCDELIATEMVFENVLESLDPPEIAGILSALIFQEKTQNEPPLTERLQTAVAKVVTIAHSLGRLQSEHGLPVDPSENVKLNLNFGLVDVVYEWARGVPFCEITQITTVQEGSVVRAITRLDELCREVRNAARVIGEPTLYRKMEATSQLIKRDIVFAASLYVA